MAETTVLNRATTRPIPLASSLGYHLRTLSESWTGMLHRSLDSRGVTQGQWRYLRELWEADGLTQRELSERVGRQGPTTVAALRMLERSGYAVVKRDAHDRRKSRVFLTAKGRKIERTAMPAVAEVERAVLDGLSDEDLAAFRRIIAHVQTNIDAQGRNRNEWSRARTGQLLDDEKD